MALVRYIHLNPVRGRLATQPERYFYSGHNDYLLNRAPKIIEAGPILKILGGKEAYKNFVLEGVSENHNEKYYAVKDQRFLGEEGFGEEISRGSGERQDRKTKPSMASAFEEITRRLETTPELLRGKDRRWDVSAKRAEAVTLLVQELGYRVSEVAEYLRRDQANISTMLSRWSSRKQ